MALTTIEPFGINSSNSFTFGNVTATGNVTGNFFIGNGSQLTGLPENYSNANVAAYLPTYTGNLASLTGNVTTTANISANYVLGNGSQLTGLPENYSNANVAAYLPTYTGNLASLTGNVTTTANISANYVLGNGSQLTGLPENYSNANVAAYLPTYSGNISANNITANTFIGTVTGGATTAGTVTTNAQPNITSVGTLTSLSSTGNITGNFFIGNGSQLTGLPASYSNANVEAYLPTYTGNLASLTGNVTTTANISANYVLGNGSQLTGLPEGYGNANVAAYLPTYTGNLASLTGNVTTTANISANYFLGNGSQLTGIQAGATTTFSSTAPSSPAQGDIWIDADTAVQYIYFNDGTSSQWAEMEAQTSFSSSSGSNVDFGSVAANIVPSANITYDLGSATNRWRDIYLSGNTINLGGATIRTDAASGAIALIPEPTVANPNPSGMVVSPSGGITVVATVGGEVSANAIAIAAVSPTAAPVPIDITTTAPQNGQALIWNAANSEFVPGNVSAGGGGGATATVYGNISGLPLSNVATGSMAFVSSNNRLYLWNGTGWFNIALINTNPTITGGANPSYVFALNGTPIVLTLVASDPEGIPLTWSYQVTSGSLGDTATVSQADNVFTITPSTDSADAGVFQLTFSASDGVNIATAASTFTLLFSAADPYYQRSVLLSTTTTNNGTNNTFVDSSTNNFAITRNGNATQGAYGPFSPAGWSGFFDGTGDYLTVPYSTTAFDWWTDNYTVEAWVYPTSFTGWSYTDSLNVKPTLIGNAAFNSTTNFWGFGLTATGTVHFAYFNGSAQGAGTSSTATLNAWNHIAMVKNGTNVTLYLNGVGTSIGNVSGTPQSSTGTTLTIGAGNNAYINGYVSNLRIVKGTAIYTANFTPSIAPLTAVSGTSLLTLQSNRFVDNSANNFAITRNGDTTIDPFSPFSPGSPYSTSANGGSAYFDGTGDFLTVADDNLTRPGAGDFTLELFYYYTGPNPTGYVNIFSYGAAGDFLRLFFFTSNTLIVWTGGTPIITSSSNALVINTWQHVAIARSGSTMRLFVNGINVGSATSSTNYATGILSIGSEIGQTAFLGYMSNFRLVRGTALYTSNFTPPTAPLTAVSGTSLLLNFTDANIFDQTGKVDLETLGDAKTSTAVVKYGTTSMAFDGTGDYLRVPSSTELDFGTGDFTIETWVNFTALSSNRVLLDRWVTGNANAWQLYWRSTGTSIAFLTGSSTILVQDPNGSNITTGTWNYIAVTRSGTTVRLFVNGIVVATATSSVSLTNTLPLGVGIQTSTLTNTLNGYLSDTRITKGYARYTANFTPPTAQLGYSNPE